MSQFVLGGDGRERTTPRYQGSGGPQGVVVLNQVLGNKAVLVVQFPEIVIQQIPLEFMLNCGKRAA